MIVAVAWAVPARTVIWTVPCARAVISPVLESTVAMLGLLELQLVSPSILIVFPAESSAMAKSLRLVLVAIWVVWGAIYRELIEDRMDVGVGLPPATLLIDLRVTPPLALISITLTPARLNP